MLNGYDIGYYTLLGLSWPVWACRRKTREKVRDAFATRAGQVAPRPGREPAVLIHAVSVGELNAARGLIDGLRAARPELHVIVTTTTQAGNELAQKLFSTAPATTVLRFPLDLSRSIARMLDALHPTLVVLMELEVWPNFLAHCERRKIPVAIANGRITAPSFHRYRVLGPLAWKMFGRLSWCIAQDEVYAERFKSLGVPPDKVRIAGTMKFDTATVGDRVPGDEDLARAVQLPLPEPSFSPDSSPSPGTPGGGRGEGLPATLPTDSDPHPDPLPGYRERERILVAGSTGPGEEAIVLDAYAQLLRRHPTLRLAIIPRKPERFDEVATLIESRGYVCVRRSRTLEGVTPVTPSLTKPSASVAAVDCRPPNAPSLSKSTASPEAEDCHPPINVVLGDTMGELRKFYALADVVFVGRTLVDLGPKQHGSDMIEPCALARPTVVGPFTGNFEEPMRAFRAANAIVEVTEPQTLFETLDEWLSQPETAREIGRRAREIVVAGKGAVQRHVELLAPML